MQPQAVTYDNDNANIFAETETSAQPIMYDTLSAEEAVYTKMADAIAADRQEVLKKLDVSGAKEIVSHRIRRYLLALLRFRLKFSQ